MKTLAHILAIIFGLFSAVHPASAMLMINELVGFQAGGVTPASISFVGCTSVADAASPLTYTNHATGTAGNRWTIVGVVVEDGATAFTIDSMTVGGSAATEITDNSAETGSLMQSALYIISNPSGTTATIDVTVSEAVTVSAVCVWAAYDLVSAAAHDTAASFHTSSGNLALSLDVPVDGIAAGICGSEQNAADATTWTGMTEQSEARTNGNTSNYSGANTVTVGTPLSVNCNWDGSSDAIGVTASFR